MFILIFLAIIFTSFTAGVSCVISRDARNNGHTGWAHVGYACAGLDVVIVMFLVHALANEVLS